MPTSCRFLRMRAPRAIAAAAMLWLVAGMPELAAQTPRRADQPVRIEIAAKPIASFDTRDASLKKFGALSFRGGIELTSAHKDFGGLSAIRVGADGAHFLAVSDKAHWLRARIVYDGKRPVGIADAEMAPVLGTD